MVVNSRENAGFGKAAGRGEERLRGQGEIGPATRTAVAKKGAGSVYEERQHMNKLELVDHIATEADLTKVSAAAALEAVLEGIVKTLKKGEEVRLVGFGTFLVKERAAGKGRNPATGKEIKIAASKNARFKPGAALKATLNKKSSAKK